jgi:hypothetical protein
VREPVAHAVSSQLAHFFAVLNAPTRLFPARIRRTHVNFSQPNEMFSLLALALLISKPVLVFPRFAG